MTPEKRYYRIRGTWYTVPAPTLRAAVRKLITDDDSEIAEYTPHWYTRTNRPAWARVRTTYGYICTVEEVRR